MSKTPPAIRARLIMAPVAAVAPVAGRLPAGVGVGVAVGVVAAKAKPAGSTMTPLTMPSVSPVPPSVTV